MIGRAEWILNRRTAVDQRPADLMDEKSIEERVRKGKVGVGRNGLPVV